MGIPSPRRPRGSLEMSDQGERRKRPMTSFVSILVQVSHVHQTHTRNCLRISTRKVQGIGTAWQTINTPAEKWKEQGQERVELEVRIETTPLHHGQSTRGRHLVRGCGDGDAGKITRGEKTIGRFRRGSTAEGRHG